MWDSPLNTELVIPAKAGNQITMFGLGTSLRGYDGRKKQQLRRSRESWLVFQMSPACFLELRPLLGREEDFAGL